jgi:lactoylglutathione lyase
MSGQGKATIVHISLKVDDLEAASRFYEGVFGFRQVATHHKEGRVTRRLTDGRLDLTLMHYESEDAPEAQLSGPGPCIHHFGIEVEDRASFADRITALGGQVLSEPGARALKFRGPDGVLAELVDVGEFAT